MNPTEARVYAALSYTVDAEGRTTASDAEIARRCDLEARYVARIIALLKYSGDIIVSYQKPASRQGRVITLPHMPPSWHAQNAQQGVAHG